MNATIFQDAGNMMLIVTMACIIVLIAMCIDLASGLYKAKLRGEIRTSQALKRTMTKFITYEGGMLIAAGVDILIHICKLFSLFGLDSIYGIPFVTCIVGIFLLVVEFLSVRENADQKTKNKMNEAVSVISDVIGKDNIKDALAQVIQQAIAESGKECRDKESE